MVTSVWREQGRTEEIREVLCLQLEQKFGPLTPAVKANVESLSLRLRARQIAVGDPAEAKSLTDLGLE